MNHPLPVTAPNHPTASRGSIPTVPMSHRSFPVANHQQPSKAAVGGSLPAPENGWLEYKPFLLGRSVYFQRIYGYVSFQLG